jgi:hypothetical protein
MSAVSQRHGLGLIPDDRAGRSTTPATGPNGHGLGLTPEVD